jgi:RNA polymerase sigma-70 factor (ECF subfamily)
MSDAELIARIARGDRQAFAEFYDRHAPRLLGLLRHWLGSRADAEDVLQESFWQVWRNAGTYDAARAAPDVWLLVMARSRALDFQRRRPAAEHEGSSGKQCTTECSEPWLAMAADELNQRVRRAVDTLPEQQRSAVCLAFYCGLTHDQIARQQAIPLGTAKTRIKLGIRRLRAMLDEEHRGPSP